jgi:outer membrane protein
MGFQSDARQSNGYSAARSTDGSRRARTRKPGAHAEDDRAPGFRAGPPGGYLDRMKRRFVIIGAALLLLTAAGRARAEVKLAYVDVQRALNECDAGKKAKAGFRTKIETLEGRLQKQQNDVQALKDELEKKGMLMKDDERRNLQDEYERKLRDFQRDYDDSKHELEQRDNEVTGAIVKDLARIIKSIGEKEGFTMVMEKGAILWGTPGIDITDEVIRDYNQSGSKVGSLGDSGDDSGASAEAASDSDSDFGDNAAKRSTISK